MSFTIMYTNGKTFAIQEKEKKEMAFSDDVSGFLFHGCLCLSAVKGMNINMGKDRRNNDMTEEEWRELCEKTEEKVKKAVRKILMIIIVIFLILSVFWVSIVYVRDYKITDVSQSVSPDGKYALVLQAVGEADWPFGPADGRLVLREGEHKIAEADFIVFDDGKTIQEDTWKVTWSEDHVEVILSGEEQTDELVRMYYDGEKEWEQLTEPEMEPEEESGRIAEETSTGADGAAVGSAGGLSGESELPQPYAKYADVLELILAEHVDPNGRSFDTADDRYAFETTGSRSWMWMETADRS